MSVMAKRPARQCIAAMNAYTLELRDAAVKLNQNESPFDLPSELKREVLERVMQRPWNRYPDFEGLELRAAIARCHGLEPDEVLTGNGSNELLGATISTFVDNRTTVILPQPSFTLYEKLVTIAGGKVVAVPIDAASGLLPADALVAAVRRAGDAVVIICSPNNPTGSILPPGGMATLLDAGAIVLFDRAYGEFARDEIPPPHDRLVTFSTFSKAWGLAALRIGWLTSPAATCREIRKVKLPYNLNVVSTAMAIAVLERRDLRDAAVARIVAERERLMRVLREIPSLTPYPSAANFIAFRTSALAREIFRMLVERGVLVRDISASLPNSLRVSIGTPEENDRFIEALEEVA